MDEAERELMPSQPRLGYPNWISSIEDRQTRHDAEQLYLENVEFQRRQDSNLKFISSLKSQCTVQKERIDRLGSKRAILITAIGGGIGVVGLAALLISNYPTFGMPLAVFLMVLLGRACFPALLTLLKAAVRKHATDRH